jgi:apolipoprotein N-acyltransferase
VSRLPTPEPIPSGRADGIAVRLTFSPKTLISIASGAVLPLAFAPFGQFWLAPLAYAALLWVWRDESPRSAFRLGYLFGFACYLSGVHWVYVSIYYYGQTHVSLALFLTVGMVAILALYPAITGYIAARWLRTSGAIAWLVLLPALWVLLEWVRGWFLSGFGWLSAGYSQTDSWLAGLAPVLGVHGVGWAVLLTAGALVTLLHAISRGAGRMRTAGSRGNAASLKTAAAMLLLLWGTAWFLVDHRWTSPRGQLLSVALLQGAVPQDLKWLPEELAETMQLYWRMTDEAAGSRLVIWPEAAIPTLYEYVPEYLEAVRVSAAEQGSEVLLGILKDNPPADHSGPSENFQNVLVALTEPHQIYTKRQLVPFGEYFPVPGFVRNWMRLMSLPYTDAVPGAASPPPMDVAGERIAAMICYEALFGAQQLHYFPDATLIVNVSNDAWFGDSIAPHQHLQIARMRAIEAGRYLLRSTNTGITAVIDPLGQVVARIPQFEQGTLRYTVQGFTGATPYVRWGNWPVIGLGLLLVAGFIVAGQLPRWRR